MTDDDILQLARALLPELPALLADASARTRLTQLIADAGRGAIAPDVLFQALAGEPAVRRWLAARLGSNEQQRGFGMSPFQQLPGQGAATAADEFACPTANCPSRWFRQRVGQQPPDCPQHRVRLVLMPKV